MKIEELMTRKVTTCSPNDTLERAAKFMWDGDCGSLPVCDEANHVVGMITDRDICMAALFEGKALNELPVHSSMAKKVLIGSPEQDISTVEKAMREAQVRRVPVVDDQGVLIGILGLADLAREAVSERAATEKDVTESEVGDTLAAICEPRANRRLAA
jgi:CBS domain-containing protein